MAHTNLCQDPSPCPCPCPPPSPCPCQSPHDRGHPRTQPMHYCSHDVSDCVVCMQVATLYNLCKALQSFHVRGMVHCSLAPLTFSWFQGGQGWKVAACGDWAHAGMHVRSCYQLRYASPEVNEVLPAPSITAFCDCTCKDAILEQPSKLHLATNPNRTRNVYDPPYPVHGLPPTQHSHH